MKITRKVGDLVRFKNGLYKEEEWLIYLILEVNNDRCFIEWVNTKMSIRPTSLAIVAELEIYMDGSELKELINSTSS